MCRFGYCRHGVVPFAPSSSSGVESMRVFGLCVLVLGLGLVLGGWIQGQDKKESPDAKKTGDTKPDEPKAKGQLPAGWKKLALTEEQVQTVYKTQASYRAKIEDHQKK